jgi:hypothetical protein
MTYRKSNNIFKVYFFRTKQYVINVNYSPPFITIHVSGIKKQFWCTVVVSLNMHDLCKHSKQDIKYGLKGKITTTNIPPPSIFFIYENQMHMNS